MAPPNLSVAILGILPGVQWWLSAVRDELAHDRWGDLAGFWWTQLFIYHGLILYFLPLLPILFFLPSRYMRHGVIATGILFIGYIYGAFYLLLWLLTCWAFFVLAERFAYEAKRTDVWRGGPPLAAGAIITGHFLFVYALNRVRLPKDFEHWFVVHAKWLLPMGARWVPWEPGWLQGAPLFQAMLGLPHLIGVAYFTMRMVHYFSDIKRGTLPPAERSFFRFLAYTCYIPLFIQGPIERYQVLQEQFDTCRERRTPVYVIYGLYRIALGFLKRAVAAGLMFPLLDVAGLGRQNPLIYLRPWELESYGLLFFGVHLQVLALYMIFSGYCDMAIGMSTLLGVRVIENFRRPWLARSLTDMWRRWHISLSLILRDYIFMPLTKRRWHNDAVVLLTFFVCGVWHDLSVPFMVWGLVMGAMVGVNHRWVRWMRRLDRERTSPLARVRRAWLKLQPLPMLCAWLITINVFLMSGWIAFGGAGGIQAMWEVIRRPVNAVLGVDLPPLMLIGGGSE